MTDTPHSEALASRLRASLPGGDTRSATFYPPYPIAFARGEGCRVWDVDGNAYTDFWNNFTSLAHGHAHPRIVEALVEQARLGTAFPAPSPLQAEHAERIRGRVSSIELLRYTNSGSEAVMLAVRAARAFTGRDLVVKAEGGYHGSWEQVPMARASLTGHDGTPEAVSDLLRWCTFNDGDSLRAIMEAEGERVACILLEPVQSGGGVIAGEPAFFREARELCDRYGALLVLDEVVTLRLALGARQADLGVDADLTALGKIIGGGLPVGAAGGRADVMEIFDPRRPGCVGHSGTFNGNVLTVAAGIASLDLLPQPEIDRINALGQRLATGMARLLREAGADGCVTTCGSLVQLHMETGKQVETYADTNMTSPLLKKVHSACLERGFLFPGRGLICVSTPMDEATIDEALAAFEGALAEVGAGVAAGVQG